LGVIQRQSLKNLLSAYAGIALGFISLFLIQPRLLTPEELGLTRILYSFSFLIATFVPLGVNNITNKYFPSFNNPERKNYGYIGFAMLITLIGLLISFALLWLTKNYVMSVYQTKSKLFVEYYYCIFPMIAIFSAIFTLTTYLIVRLKTTVPPFINDVVVRILVMGVVTIYHFQLLTFSQFIYGFIGVYIIQLILLLSYLYYIEKPGWIIEWGFFKKQPVSSMFTYGLMLWTGTVAVVGFKELSTIMLARFMSLEYVAIYTIAAFIPTVIEAPLGALEKIASAKISYAWNENNKIEIQKIYNKSVKYLLLIGGLLFVGINVNIVNLLNFLPSKYSEGHYVVLIISISSMFNMATGLNNAILLYSNKYKPGALLMVLLVVVNFILQMLLVPHIGLIGAAIATAVSQILFNGANFLMVWRYFHFQPFDKTTLLILAMITGCFLFNFIIPSLYNPFMDILFRSIMISMLYIGATVYFKLVPELYGFLPLEKIKTWFK